MTPILSIGRTSRPRNLRLPAWILFQVALICEVLLDLHQKCSQGTVSTNRILTIGQRIYIDGAEHAVDHLQYLLLSSALIFLGCVSGNLCRCDFDSAALFQGADIQPQPMCDCL